MKNLILSIVFFAALSTQAQDRIIAEQVAKGDQAPWQLSLKSKFGSHFCGAVLIEPDIVLTAAHCVWTDGPGDLSVNGGSTAGTLGGVKRLPGATDIIIHPLFERKNFTAHDIAIIVLRSEIQASNVLMPVQIIDNDFPIQIDQDFHTLTQWSWETSGWGMTTPPNIIQTPSEQLMYTNQRPLASSNVSIQDPVIQEYLKETYDIGESTVTKISSLDSRTILAEGINEISGTCSGDSGGPFVTEYKGQRYLAGISSYTAGGEKQCLGVSVYTNVQAYSHWIKSEITRIRARKN